MKTICEQIVGSTERTRTILRDHLHQFLQANSITPQDIDALLDCGKKPHLSYNAIQSEPRFMSGTYFKDVSLLVNIDSHRLPQVPESTLDNPLEKLVTDYLRARPHEVERYVVGFNQGLKQLAVTVGSDQAPFLRDVSPDSLPKLLYASSYVLSQMFDELDTAVEAFSRPKPKNSN